MTHQVIASTCDKAISGRGLRLTDQRRAVYDALMGQRDHPTAVEVFLRVKEKMPSISLATVYNCLEALAACGLVKHVNLDRAPSRYCPNLEEHGHFFCTGCGAIIDVPLKKDAVVESLWQLPRHAIVSHRELHIRGLCPSCASAEKPKSQRKT